MPGGLARHAQALFAPVDAPTLEAAVRQAGLAAEPEPALRFLIDAARGGRPSADVALDLDGAEAFWRLPVADRAAQTSVLAALADAWLRRDEAFAVRLDMARRLMPLGAWPVVVAGDRQVRLLRRSGLRGTGFLLPLLLAYPTLPAGRLAEAPGLAAAVGQARELPCVFAFGHVDAGFLLALRRLGGADDWIDATVAAYAAALHRLDVGRRATVLGLLPPAEPDAVLAAGEIDPEMVADHTDLPARVLFHGLRGLVWPDLPARTAMGARFNARLAAAVRPMRFDDPGARLLRDGVADARCVSGGRLRFDATSAPIEAALWAAADATRAAMHG